MQVAFAAADGISGLKLVEMGVPKDKLALLAIPLTPLQIALPWILGRYTAGPRPMDVFQTAYPYKLITSLLLAMLVYWTPAWRLADEQFPILYYVVVVLNYCLHQVMTRRY